MWETDTYVWSGYGPQKICYHTQGKVSIKMKNDPVNEKTQVNDQHIKSWEINLKYILDQ